MQEKVLKMPFVARRVVFILFSWQMKIWEMEKALSRLRKAGSRDYVDEKFFADNAVIILGIV